VLDRTPRTRDHETACKKIPALHLGRVPALIGSLIAVAGVVLGSPRAIAQEPPATGEESAAGAFLDLSLDDLFNLKVTTASGDEEERSLASANVTVITSSDIDRRRWRSLDEILREVPGLYVVDDYAFPSVGVREVTPGFRAGTRIIKMMIDGYAVSFRPDLNAFIGPELIPIDAIERIEIAKGPLSALYGANAFLATINVVTKKGHGRQATVATETSVRGSVVSWGMRSLVAAGDAHRGALIAFSTQRNDRSGLSVAPTFANQDPASSIFSTPSANDQSNPFSLFGRLHADSESAGNFVLEGALQHLDNNGEFQLSSILTHRNRIVLENRWLALHWTRELGSKLQLKVLLGGAEGHPGRETQLYLTGNPNYFFRPNYGYEAGNAGVELTFTPLPRLTLKLGADGELDHENVLWYTQTLNAPQNMRGALEEIPLIGDGDRRVAWMVQRGVYAQGSTAPLTSHPDLRVTLNGRLDWIHFGDVNFPAQYSWRAAVANRWSPVLTTRIVAGRAFQTPSGTLLFANSGLGNFANVLGSQVAQVDTRQLRPQTVSSLEIGATARVGEHLSLEVNAFDQILTDAIAFVQYGTFYVARNQGERSVQGVELTAHLMFGPVRPYVVANASRHLFGASANAPEPSPLYPSYFGHAGVETTLLRGLLFADVHARMVGPRGASQGNQYLNNSQTYQLPRFVTLHATVTAGDFHVLAPDLGTQLSLTVSNALDHRYFEPGFGGIDVPQLGRTVLFQLRQQL
jgi:outer membrane receptor protein involved in Fe transport